MDKSPLLFAGLLLTLLGGSIVVETWSQLAGSTVGYWALVVGVVLALAGIVLGVAERLVPSEPLAE